MMSNILSKLNFILIAALFILYSIPSTGLGSLTIDPASQDPGPQRKVKSCRIFLSYIRICQESRWRQSQSFEFDTPRYGAP